MLNLELAFFNKFTLCFFIKMSFRRALSPFSSLQNGNNKQTTIITSVIKNHIIFCKINELGKYHQFYQKGYDFL